MQDSVRGRWKCIGSGSLGPSWQRVNPLTYPRSNNTGETSTASYTGNAIWRNICLYNWVYMARFFDNTIVRTCCRLRYKLEGWDGVGQSGAHVMLVFPLSKRKQHFVTLFIFLFFTSNRLLMRQFWCYMILPCGFQHVFDATALKILKGFHVFQVKPIVS